MAYARKFLTALVALSFVATAAAVLTYYDPEISRYRGDEGLISAIARSERTVVVAVKGTKPGKTRHCGQGSWTSTNLVLKKVAGRSGRYSMHGVPLQLREAPTGSTWLLNLGHEDWAGQRRVRGRANLLRIDDVRSWGTTRFIGDMPGWLATLLYGFAAILIAMGIRGRMVGAYLFGLFGALMTIGNLSFATQGFEYWTWVGICTAGAVGLILRQWWGIWWLRMVATVAFFDALQSSTAVDAIDSRPYLAIFSTLVLFVPKIGAARTDPDPNVVRAQNQIGCALAFCAPMVALLAAPLRDMMEPATGFQTLTQLLVVLALAAAVLLTTWRTLGLLTLWLTAGLAAFLIGASPHPPTCGASIVYGIALGAVASTFLTHAGAMYRLLFDSNVSCD